MSDKGHELTDKKLAELEKKLKAHYKQASDEVQKKLDDYLKAFKAKDARHLADLQKDFTKENYEEYIRWRQGQVLISERWEEMRQSLAEDYHHANMEAKSIIDGYMPDIYALNHNYGTYDVEHNALVDTSYTLYDRQTVERLMRDDPDMLPPPGKKVSKRIAEGKDMLWNKSMIQSSMWQSITQGESMNKIAKRLAQTVGDKDMAAAVRNARTMTTGAECAGRVDSYKRAESMGIHLQQEWMATLDGRTRHTHRQLHGERIPVDGTFSNGCRFPGDPNGEPEEVYNCRCTLVSAVKGFEGDKVMYSPKLGDMSFEEWVGEKEENQYLSQNTRSDIKGNTSKGNDNSSADAFSKKIYNNAIDKTNENDIMNPNRGSSAFSAERKNKMLRDEAILSGNNYETAVIYNADGTLSFKKRGSLDKVSFTKKEIANMEGKVLTHNHPNGSNFSVADIDFLREGKLQEIRACNSNGAYVLRRKDSWSEHLSDREAIEKAYNQIEDSLLSKHLDLKAQNGLSFSQYIRQLDDDVMSEFSKKYGLEYYWEERII